MAFQLADALLLLLGSFSKTKEYVIDSYYPTDAISRPDDANMCQMRKEKVQMLIRNLNLNRCICALGICLQYLLRRCTVIVLLYLVQSREVNGGFLPF